jgi:AcrR family transcriptional regulator/DNA-binding MarR family transcriptional regulator
MAAAVKAPGTRSAAAARRPAARSVSAQDRRLTEIQRSRLLAGAVGAIEQFGYAQATVARITARARVSRRTFYEIFDNREECVNALIDEALRSVENEIAAARLEQLPWRERVRGGLVAILAFFDREPALARVCVVQALRGGPRVQELREEILARLAAALDAGRAESPRADGCPALTAEGLVGAAFAIVHSRLQRPEHEPLTGLAAELMSLIVLPYLGSAAARREQARSTHAPASVEPGASAQLRSERDPLQEVPMRLTYRTTRVLLCIAERPAASNRVVAEQAGIADQGQVSKLLARLERLGLTANAGVGHSRGEANAWNLTPLGERVAQRLRLDHTNAGRRAA